METIPLTDPRSEATRQRLIDTGLTLSAFFKIVVA